MMNNRKYFMIKKLISLWDEYEEESGNENLQEFADWLIRKNRTVKSAGYAPDLYARPGLPEYRKFAGNLDLKRRFLDIISRLSRFHEFYTRKFLAALPLNSRLEYLFLYAIDVMGPAKKTEIIHLHLVEFTAGVDLIQRLTKQGLISELHNPADKRTKLLTLTDKGKRILNQAHRKVSDEVTMVLSCIDENKWKKALPVLEDMHDFHHDVYIRHGEKNDAELLNLVASLKYLYK